VTIVNVLEAKNNLSKLIESVESGVEKEVIIARNGRPAVKLVALGWDDRPPLLGIAKGEFEVPDNIDEDNEEIARMFYGDDDE